MPSHSTTLDVRGLRCPLPVLRARKAMRDVLPGGVLTVLVTDAAAVIDFPHFCHQTGLELLSTSRNGELLTFMIRKPATGPRIDEEPEPGPVDRDIETLGESE